MTNFTYSAAALDRLQKSDNEVYNALMQEEVRQSDGIELIPSENYCFPEVYMLLGSVFNNKYSEGYPGRRYYGGQENTDKIETLARERAKAVFRAEHANVQPLSGCPMNEAVYFALLQPGDKIMGMALTHGGHLSHGHPVTNMAKIFKFVRYQTEPENGVIDLAKVRQLALEEKPKLIICGHSSYPREYDYEGFRKIADEAGCLLMADVSHLGGIIAGGALKNPLDYGFDVVTTTTHKSLRGPRGGMILCKKQYAAAVDKAVFPGMQGGPHMHQIAALASTLKLVQTDAYKAYARQILANAQAFAGALLKGGAHLVTGGTENHLIVINTATGFGITGDIAERALDRVGITLNKNVIPDDPNPPMKPSGIRFGTPAATSRGMKEHEMEQLANVMLQVLRAPGDEALLDKLHVEVRHLCQRFPVPGIDATPQKCCTAA